MAAVWSWNRNRIGATRSTNSWRNAIPQRSRYRRTLSGSTLDQSAENSERGDIYLVSLDPIQGHEQQGRRSVLVVSPAAFNRLANVPIVLPITTGGDFARVRGFTVSLVGAGTQTIGVIRCDHPRALDFEARGGRRLESVPAAVVDKVLAKLAPLFD
jgi:mRNA-degrading endonuclease toxin of MazEF toxin-antitoxin module